MNELRALEPDFWRAPSAHNTQPWTLRYTATEAAVGWDPARSLPVSDPTGRDLRLSLGALVECCLIVCADAGLHIGFRPDPGPLRVGFLHRAGRPYETPFTTAAVRARGANRGDYHPGRVPDEVAAGLTGMRRLACRDVAELLHEADLQQFGTREVTRELRAWLRLTRRHRRYLLDGLSDRPLALSKAAAFVLRASLALFPALRRLGLPRVLAGASRELLDYDGDVLVLINPPGDARSILANDMFIELMTLPPEDRRLVLEDLTETKARQVYAAAYRVAGTSFALWSDDPVGFVEQVLGAVVWSVPRQFMTALTEHKQVAVPSCFSSSKTFSAGQLVLWHSLVHPVGTGVTVSLAPLWRLVVRQLWREVRGAHSRAGLPGVIDMAQYKLPDANGLDTVVAYGIAAAPHNEAAVQGIHSNQLLLVVEEAGGIAHTIGDNLAGLLVGDGAKMIAIGNPPTDEVNTWFEKLCRDEDVKTIPISAFDTPNLTKEYFGECQSCPGGGHSPAKHMVDKQWIDRTTRVHGPNSNYVRAKIHALFPKGLANVVIPADWVQAAVDVDEPDLVGGVIRLRDLCLEGEHAEWAVTPGAWVRLGVDVAADGGDELVVARILGDLATVEHTSSGPENADPVAVAGVILKEIHRAEALAQALGSTHPVRVKIDGNGIGWGVAGRLAAWGREGIHGAEIVSVLVSESPKREPDEATLRPYLKRDEMWLAGRAMLRPDEYGVTRLRLRVDEMTAAQLSAPKLSTNSSGYSMVEPKKAMKKRGVSSPDRGEGLLLGRVRARGGRGLLAHHRLKRGDDDAHTRVGVHGSGVRVIFPLVWRERSM
ncbi:hypothetical protein ABGB18_46560 [Nonomuraea sp. B12E4]|uniref:hypothetical protein n=1 Tax=Nonomuraea sp. B12E4 TaxID=3153564 RepID=UPI00325D897E